MLCVGLGHLGGGGRGFSPIRATWQEEGELSGQKPGETEEGEGTHAGGPRSRPKPTTAGADAASPKSAPEASSPRGRFWILKKKCTANVSSQIKRKKHGQLLIKYRRLSQSGGAARADVLRAGGQARRPGWAPRRSGVRQTHTVAHGQRCLERNGKTWAPTVAPLPTGPGSRQCSRGTRDAGGHRLKNESRTKPKCSVAHEDCRATRSTYSPSPHPHPRHDLLVGGEGCTHPLSLGLAMQPALAKQTQAEMLQFQVSGLSDHLLSRVPGIAVGAPEEDCGETSTPASTAQSRPGLCTLSWGGGGGALDHGARRRVLPGETSTPYLQE